MCLHCVGVGRVCVCAVFWCSSINVSPLCWGVCVCVCAPARTVFLVFINVSPLCWGMSGVCAECVCVWAHLCWICVCEGCVRAESVCVRKLVRAQADVP